jgi:hypothetical protein
LNLILILLIGIFFLFNPNHWDLIWFVFYIIFDHHYFNNYLFLNSILWDFIFIPSLVVVILTVVFYIIFIIDFCFTILFLNIFYIFYFVLMSVTIFFSFIFLNYFFQFHSWISHWFIVWIIIFFDVKISVSSPRDKCEILTRVDISLFLPFCFKLFFSQIHHSTLYLLKIWFFFFNLLFVKVA